MTSDPGSWLSLPQVPDLLLRQEPAEGWPEAKGESHLGMIKALEKQRASGMGEVWEAIK